MLATAAHTICIAVFLFLYFLFLFFIKIYFRFGILQKYTPAAQLPPPGSRAAGAYPQKNDKKLQTGPWGPIASSRAAGPPHPFIRCWLPLTPSFVLLKIQKKRKEREGGRGGVRERQSGEALSDFQAGDFR